MDAIDRKLLSALTEDARTPATRLAKRARVSREVASYRLNRLARRGIIRKFVTRIDMGRLGFKAAALFLTLRQSREREFRAYVKASNHLSWVGEWTGVWSYALSIVGRDDEEIDGRFHDLFDRFKADIVAHRFALHKRTRFFQEKLFGETTGGKAEKTVEKDVDETDKRILRILSDDARSDYVALSKRTKLTAQAIRQRVKRLEKSGAIQQYTLFLDLKALGLQQYSVLVRAGPDAGKLLSHLAAHPDVSFVAEYVGDPFLEFGLVVEDPYRLRGLLQGIGDLFPENRVLELSLFEETLVAAGPPPCVFE